LGFGSPVPFFFLPRPNSLPRADRSVDFFRCGESILWFVFLLFESLIMEYLAALSAGLVALRAGGDTLEGDAPSGELLRGEDL
jgi:hypothetical protein